MRDEPGPRLKCTQKTAVIAHAVVIFSCSVVVCSCCHPDHLCMQKTAAITQAVVCSCCHPERSEGSRGILLTHTVRPFLPRFLVRAVTFKMSVATHSGFSPVPSPHRQRAHPPHTAATPPPSKPQTQSNYSAPETPSQTTTPPATKPAKTPPPTGSSSTASAPLAPAGQRST